MSSIRLGMATSLMHQMIQVRDKHQVASPTITANADNLGFCDLS